jgi:hypothetical protein
MKKPKGITLLYLILIVLFHGISSEVDKALKEIMWIVLRS